jgi:hypothetical protein
LKILITIEGAQGAGKTSIARAITEMLLEQGIEARLPEETGDVDGAIEGLSYLQRDLCKVGQAKLEVTIVTKHAALDIFDKINDDVATYFRDLGFTVTWDFDKRTGLHWYEIYEDNKLLAQIDFGASLAAIQEDLPLLAVGKPGTSKGADWKVHCEDDAALRRLAAKMVTPPPEEDRA